MHKAHRHTDVPSLREQDAQEEHEEADASANPSVRNKGGRLVEQSLVTLSSLLAKTHSLTAIDMGYYAHFHATCPGVPRHDNLREYVWGTKRLVYYGIYVDWYTARSQPPLAGDKQ